MYYDRYKEGRYPENMEKLTILNTSPLEADISFCFLNDSRAETYLLDPPTMLLAPGDQQVMCTQQAAFHLIPVNNAPLMFLL